MFEPVPEKGLSARARCIWPKIFVSTAVRRVLHRIRMCGAMGAGAELDSRAHIIGAVLPKDVFSHVTQGKRRPHRSQHDKNEQQDQNGTVHAPL